MASKTVPVMGTKKGPEYLSQDILEEDFVNIYVAVFKAQFLMGSCRVDTKNRFVTPPTLLQKFYTILCILFTMGSSYVVISIYLALIPDRNVTSLAMSILASYFLAFFFNIVHVRFMNGPQNVEFHVKMQNLDRLLKIEKRKVLNNKLRRSNVASVVLLVISFGFITVLTCITQEFIMLIFLALTLCVMSNFLELVVCSTIVLYFYIRVKFVNFIIVSYLNQDCNVRKPVILDGVSQKSIQFAAVDTDNCLATSDIENYLKEIFNCFAMFQNLYRFQLLLFCIKLVVISLLSFEMVLYTMSKNIYTTSQNTSLVIFMAIDWSLAAFLAFRFGSFFGEVKETKRLCIAVMALHQDGLLREKAKSMLKLVEETPPTFSVYDMWHINAGMFVTIFSLVTSLIVTLIQFAFL